VSEQPAKARARKALEKSDRAQQSGDEASLGFDLPCAPPGGEPDLVTPDDELQREDDRDELEDMRGAARRQRQRRHRASMTVRSARSLIPYADAR
jgi:hypothetical protein